jgi:hypothetical protein
MTDYQIQNSTRRCAITGRELKPGERYYSVLLDEGGNFTRKDYSLEAWQGPPAGAFSFWQGRLTTARIPRKPAIDDEMLVDCFHRLEGDLEPNRVSFRFVLALLLLRRRRFKLEETRQEGATEVLVLRCLRSGVRSQVVDPGMSDEELESVQDDVFRAIGWE